MTKNIFLVNKDGKWGAVNKFEKEVIKCEYDVLTGFVDGYAVAIKGKKTFILSIG